MRRPTAHKNMAGVRKRQVRSGRRRVNALDDWFDPIETQTDDRVRSFIQAKLDESLQRPDGALASGLTTYREQRSLAPPWKRDVVDQLVAPSAAAEDAMTRKCGKYGFNRHQRPPSMKNDLRFKQTRCCCSTSRIKMGVIPTPNSSYAVPIGTSKYSYIIDDCGLRVLNGRTCCAIDPCLCVDKEWRRNANTSEKSDESVEAVRVRAL